MNPFLASLTHKKVLVFGLGRQGGGTGDLAWLKQQGINVRASDRDTTLCPEGQTKEQIDWADLIIKNPGVPDDHELLVYGKKLHKPILTSIAIFVKYADIITIGVTGTRGKSTTTALIANLLESAYQGQVVIGGNIPGTSGLGLFDEARGKKYAVLELSSFQLHNFHDLKISPRIAVITNLYPDHLNRYPSMQAYQHDKEAICQYQSKADICLFNADNPGAVAIAQVSPAQTTSYSASDVADWSTPLPGLHNRENIAASWTLGQALGITESLARQVVARFNGVPYRQEVVGRHQGITYINDTTATTPVATLKAIDAASPNTVLICGGASKNLPYDALVQNIASSSQITCVVLLGSKTIPDFVAALRAACPDKVAGQVDSMESAIDLAQAQLKNGGTILLSPGFASFDLFKNEFDRGDQFNELVKKICAK